MKIVKRFLPLLFLFSFGYSQDWKLSENEYLIKHKGKEYHSKLAERGGSIAYYIYRIDENGEEEITGDDPNEVQDYKDLALASHYNFNKGKILLKINRDLELFRSSNNHYRVGEILNKIVEELSELNATLILNIGNKEFSLAKELYEKYSQEVKGFSKNFMNEVIKDKDKIKSLDDLVKKLEEKIFNSTVIEAKKSIKKLENAKKVLLVSHTLSTHEVRLAEKLVSDGTIKGYSTSAFQDEYIRNIDQVGYQLTHVGSSMLKSFPEGERAYDLVKRLGIKGIEEIDSEALRRSFEKMKKIHERISLSMGLYKENLDLGVEGSSANLLIKELTKNSKVNWYSGLKVMRGDAEGNVKIEDDKIDFYLFEKKGVSYTFITLDKDLKDGYKKHYISFKMKLSEFNKLGSYVIAVGPSREPVYDEKGIGTLIEYWRYSQDNWIDWRVIIDNRKNLLTINSARAEFNNQNDDKYRFPFIKELSRLDNWYFKIFLLDRDGSIAPIRAIVTDFVYKSR